LISDWQFAPLWIVDYVCSAWLLAGFWLTRQRKNIPSLIGAWAFATGVFYMALFVSLDPELASVTVREDKRRQGVFTRFLEVVKERLGHRRISTTERYLHSLPNADETALHALDKMRMGQGEQGNVKDLKHQLEEDQSKINELHAVIADQLIAQSQGSRRNLRPV
jgi:hypothetical protein